jgi:hypothetical protein
MRELAAAPTTTARHAASPRVSLELSDHDRPRSIPTLAVRLTLPQGHVEREDTIPVSHAPRHLLLDPHDFNLALQTQVLEEVRLQHLAGSTQGTPRGCEESGKELTIHGEEGEKTKGAERLQTQR